MVEPALDLKRLADEMVTLLVGPMLIYSPLWVVLNVAIAIDAFGVRTVNSKIHAHCESNSV